MNHSCLIIDLTTSPPVSPINLISDDEMEISPSESENITPSNEMSNPDESDVSESSIKSRKRSRSERDDPSTYVPRWINVRKWKETPPMAWRGLDRGDGRYRLYQKIPHYFPGKIRRQYRRGRLMSTFSRVKLLRIAWKVGVVNPDGFDISDCPFWNVTPEKGFEFFVNGWEGTTKETLIQYLWNKLEETDQILVS